MRSRAIAADLVSYERLKDLASLGSKRGIDWVLVNTVKQGIEQCRQPLDGADQALAVCWQEIAERVGMTSVSCRPRTSVSRSPRQVSTERVWRMRK